jgi:hypothetical protein
MITRRELILTDARQGKIDDIEGSADGRPWSVRGMLTASPKY